MIDDDDNIPCFEVMLGMCGMLKFGLILISPILLSVDLNV